MASGNMQCKKKVVSKSNFQNKGGTFATGMNRGGKVLPKYQYTALLY